MQDDPRSEQLLSAIVRLLSKQVVPALQDPALAFRVRIAAHLLGTVQREEATADEDDASALADLVELGHVDPPDVLNRATIRAAIREGEARWATAIREGRNDAASDAALQRSLEARLRVSNPRFDLSLVLGEDAWTS